LENDNFKTVYIISSVSTEWIVLVCSMKYVVTILQKVYVRRTGNEIDS